ncbi:hypothetical protein E4U33_006788 [Claviceps sp. LM78 group G4]|nr:hypothetical protein E4U33_006788 [Claviceps sp. LM78 group G4]
MTTFIGNHIPIERIIVEDDDDDDLAIAASFLLHLKMLWIMKRVVYRPYRLQEHLYDRNPQELVQ